ncbi:hypothetical protein HYS31_04025 [Candidatus Woesearchaeota archaeon]|nr:hypothetical protein [Candidatus Woesearchaeota archaeon]
MKSSKAFAPASISCIFRIYSHKNPRWAGSYGVGFTLNEGVIAEAAESDKNIVLFNDKKISFPAVSSAIKRLTSKKLKIRITTKLPLGCGFGLSGASALASAYAINKLLGLKKSKKELAIIAHTADAENKTGLGDVANQYYGGFCVKLRPSSHFEVVKLPIYGIDVYCRRFSRISTKSVIANTKIKNMINMAAAAALNDIKALLRLKNKKHIEFRDIIKISKRFAVSSGLLKDKKTSETIKKIERGKGNASMIMLGNAVFSDKPFNGAKRFMISGKGARIL